MPDSNQTTRVLMVNKVAKQVSMTKMVATRENNDNKQILLNVAKRLVCIGIIAFIKLSLHIW